MAFLESSQTHDVDSELYCFTDFYPCLFSVCQDEAQATGGGCQMVLGRVLSSNLIWF